MIDVPSDRRRDHDRVSRDELIERYLPLARHLARRYKRGAELEDLYQVAAFALVKAVDRFDPDRGIAFSSFAVPTIAGELKRYFRDLGWVVRVPRDVQELKLRLDRMVETLTGELGRSPTPGELADRTGASVEDVIEALGAGLRALPRLARPARSARTARTRSTCCSAARSPATRTWRTPTLVDGLLGTLPEREREILRLRFEDELTQAEIGRRLGVSQMHVSRLIRQSIAKLQRASIS